MEVALSRGWFETWGEHKRDLIDKIMETDYGRKRVHSGDDTGSVESN